jgi:peptidoglycan/xylan/chitin deacetylase (PgdA/CDA1 family)
MSASAQIRRLAAPLFRRAIGRSTALRFAARGGRSLVLLYHRVLPDDVTPDPIVPSVPVSLFRRQVELLLDAGDIVPVRELVESPRREQRPRFALTFDDDHTGYVETVLPALEARRVPATFFLSGRALHGLPPYWWTSVECSLRTHGLDFTRKTLGVAAQTVGNIAVELEQSGRAAQLVSRLPPVNEPPMTSADVRALAQAGMTIGFHTLHHPVLTTQSGRALEAALNDGRLELAIAAGTGVDFLAYPHGRASAGVAEAAERANYAAAFTTGGRPITPDSDRFLLDRWEPGRLEADEFGAQLAMRLLRPPTPTRANRHKRADSARSQQL